MKLFIFKARAKKKCREKTFFFLYQSLQEWGKTEKREFSHKNFPTVSRIRMRVCTKENYYTIWLFCRRWSNGENVTLFVLTEMNMIAPALAFKWNFFLFSSPFFKQQHSHALIFISFLLSCHWFRSIFFALYVLWILKRWKKKKHFKRWAQCCQNKKDILLLKVFLFPRR